MITNSVEEALLLSDRIVPMTRGPRATLGTPVPVDLRRPRSASELIHDDHAAHVRAHVRVADRVGRSGTRTSARRGRNGRHPPAMSRWSRE